jgi:predicted molibdopterin-dependent oxidoreductase YjgC
VLLGADPLSDFPDRALARRGLSNAGFVVAVDLFRTASVELADVVLPAAGYAEKAGSSTNIEGRVMRLNQKVTAPGTSRADWEIAVDLASRIGTELGFETLEALSDEVARVAPAYAGLTGGRLRDEKDGVVVPLAGVERPGPDLLGAPDAADPGAPPAIDNYSLRLVTSRELYDDGVHVVKNPHFAPLRRPAVLRLNHYDLDRLGVAPGGDVRVTSPRASLTLPVASDDGVPRGSAFLTYNLGTEGAADLLDADAIVTDVRVETP